MDKQLIDQSYPKQYFISILVVVVALIVIRSFFRLVPNYRSILTSLLRFLISNSSTVKEIESSQNPIGGRYYQERNFLNLATQWLFGGYCYVMMNDGCTYYYNNKRFIRGIVYFLIHQKFGTSALPSKT